MRKIATKARMLATARSAGDWRRSHLIAVHQARARAENSSFSMPCSWKRTAYTATLAAHAVVARASRIAPRDDSRKRAPARGRSWRRGPGRRDGRPPPPRLPDSAAPTVSRWSRRYSSASSRRSNLAEVVGWPNRMPCVIAALYLLGIMYFIGQGGFRRVLAGTDINEIELALQRGGKKGSASRVIARTDSAAAMTDAPSATSEASASVSEEGVEGKDPRSRYPSLRCRRRFGLARKPKAEIARGAPGRASSGSTAATRDGTAFRDRFSKQMAAVREFYGLSGPARRRWPSSSPAATPWPTSPSCCFVSENTVRTHPKRIYVKLDVHKRQELHRPRRALRAGRALKAGTILNAVRPESRQNCRARAPSIAPAAAPWCSGGRGTGGRGLCPGPC